MDIRHWIPIYLIAFFFESYWSPNYEADITLTLLHLLVMWHVRFCVYMMCTSHVKSAQRIVHAMCFYTMSVIAQPIIDNCFTGTLSIVLRWYEVLFFTLSLIGMVMCENENIL